MANAMSESNNPTASAHSRRYSFKHYFRIVVKKRIPVTREVPKGSKSNRLSLLVLLATLMSNMLVEGFFSSYSLIYNSVVESFHVSRAAAGWVGSCFLSVPFILSPLSSFFCLRFGCRWSAVCGGLLTVSGWLLASYSSNIVTLGISLGLITAMGLSLVAIPSLVILPVYFDKHMYLATSVSIAGSGVGTMLMAPMVQALISKHQWRFTFRVLSGISVLLVLCGLFYHEGSDAIGLVSMSSASTKKSSNVKTVQAETTKSCFKREESVVEVAVSKLDYEWLPKKSESFSGSNHSDGAVGKKIGEVEKIFAGMENEMKVSKVSKTSFHFGRHFTRSAASRDSGDCKNLCFCRKHNQVERESERSRGRYRSLVRNKIFIFFCIQSFVLFFSYDTPILNLSAFAQLNGVSAERSSYLFSIFGGANSISQILLGCLSDLGVFNNLFLLNSFIIVAGVATVAAVWATTFSHFAIYSSIYGFFISSNYALTTPLFIEYFGVRSLAQAYGVSSMVEGFATLLGPPLGGFLFDRYGDYRYTFCLSGIVIITSGLVIYVLPFTSLSCRQGAVTCELKKSDVE